MLQLRKAQTDTANAQALQTVAENRSKELDAKVASLEKRIEALAKQANSDKTAAEENIAALNNKLAERESRIAQYSEALEKWKQGYEKAAAVAREKEDERAKLASEIIVLKRIVADREAKNIALFNTANDILDRFENYSLGKALGAKEPFIGKSRVTVENLVQGYKDRIIDNRISAEKSKP
jgi:DNA repair exonuclease SbcCD ATPase subunit